MFVADRKGGEEVVQRANGKPEDGKKQVQKAVFTAENRLRKSVCAIHVVEKRADQEEKQEALRADVGVGEKPERKDTGKSGKKDGGAIRSDLGECKVSRAEAKQQADRQHDTQRVFPNG